MAIYTERQDEIAAVLTDMAMPVMDGPATVRALRKINPAVKIIVASGSNFRRRIGQPDRFGNQTLPRQALHGGSVVEDIANGAG